MILASVVSLFLEYSTSFLILALPLPGYVYTIVVYLSWSLITGLLPAWVVRHHFGNSKKALQLLLLWPVISLLFVGVGFLAALSSGIH